MSELLPCPFCGAGETVIRPNGRVWGGKGWGTPSSVSIQHWCPAVEGQPSRMLERVGRDEASAIEAWNTRAQPAPAVDVESLLRRWLAFHTESAGMTPEIIHDDEKFSAFMSASLDREQALIADTKSALAFHPQAQESWK